MDYAQYLTFLQEFGADILGLYLYQDYLEVIFFTFVIYRCLMWLKQDHTKHLVFASYSYFSCLTLSYYFSCTILFSTLLILAPVCLMLCVILHQKQLQKNFVLPSTKHTSIKTMPHKNWIDTLIQSCLIASHHNKHISCIIERNDHIHSLLQTKFILQLPVQKDITDLLLASTNIHNHSLLWTNQSGIIQSINVSWSSFLIQELFVTPQTDSYIMHDEAAILLTQKTDALVFEINTTKNNNTIWYQGKCMQNMTTHQLLVFVKEILQYTDSPKSSIKRKNHDKTNHASS